jgi:CRP-like cAMP-binding protein
LASRLLFGQAALQPKLGRLVLVVCLQADRPQVLVVEDNFIMAQMVCDLVRDFGFDVAGPVAHVETAMRMLAERPVDGAIVDINLDGVSSFPVCDELARRKVPFFFLTGYDRTNIPEPFRRAPLLTKPVERQRFRSALTALVPLAGSAVPSGPGADPAGANLLLEALAPEDRQLLLPLLETVSLGIGEVLEQPGQPIRSIYFPLSGMISLYAGAADRQRIEIAMIGSDGMTGASLLLGGREPFAAAIVQFAASALRIPVEPFSSLLAEHRGLHAGLLRYLHRLFDQVSFNTLAIGQANIEQRLARWLLMAADRCGAEVIAVTHNVLAQALGVRRSGITVSLHMLESRGLLMSRRRRIEIIDRAGLVKAAGGFYGASQAMPGGMTRLHTTDGHATHGQATHGQATLGHPTQGNSTQGDDAPGN